MHEVNLYIVTKGNVKYSAGYWSYVLETIINEKTYTKEDKGIEGQVTKNSIELIALYRALKRLTKPCHITLHTANTYLFGVIHNNWMEVWTNSGWRTAKGEPVKNCVYWSEIWQRLKGHKLKVELCKTQPYKKWQENEIRSLENVEFTKWEG
jgi:ribonuclease HI